MTTSPKQVHPRKACWATSTRALRRSSIVILLALTTRGFPTVVAAGSGLRKYWTRIRDGYGSSLNSWRLPATAGRLER